MTNYFHARTGLCKAAANKIRQIRRNTRKIQEITKIMTKVREISRVYPTESPCKNQKRKKRRRNALCDAMISESLKSELQRMSLALDHDVHSHESPKSDASCHLTIIDFKDEVLQGHILFLNYRNTIEMSILIFTTSTNVQVTGIFYRRLQCQYFMTSMPRPTCSKI